MQMAAALSRVSRRLQVEEGLQDAPLVLSFRSVAMLGSTLQAFKPLQVQ